jgi:hypothetical protein
MKRYVLFIVLFLAVGGFFQVAACTCGEASFSRQVEIATAVFRGRVIAKHKSKEVEQNGIKVTVLVERVWKGRVSQKAFIYTGPTADLYPVMNLCAPVFRIGQTYIFMGKGSDHLETDICSGTMTIREAGLARRLSAALAASRVYD